MTLIHLKCAYRKKSFEKLQLLAGSDVGSCLNNLSVHFEIPIINNAYFNEAE